jgi:hypothetical protein
MRDMATLVLGPLLRYAGETEATVWVETDEPCTVEVLGHTASTFEVAGHHYALVVIDGLEPGRDHPYEVALDGERRWPEPGSAFPPSLIRTIARGRPLHVLFGSCRVTLPHEPPYTLSPDEHEQGREHDALYAVAKRMEREPVERWPDKILMLGDQVYADEGSPRARDRIRARRDVSRPPGLEVADFEEYTWLYEEAWGDPTIRWLLSTVATAMVWDDHDVHDDWNISSSWVRDMRDEHWWEERILGAVVSYWVYQHLGNLAPEQLREDATWERVRSHEGDAAPLLREFAHRADRQAEGTRWSYCRDWADVRVVVMDSRAGRVLEDTRHSHEHGRAMVDDDEWEWIERHATGGVRHLILATSVPVFLLPGLHWLEAWSEAVCDGAWGRPGRAAGERARRALDLEAWPAFADSFHRLAELIRAVAAGERGEAPETIVVVAGDVHHAYVSRVDTGDLAVARTYQAVCSPFRNALDRREKGTLRFGGRPIGRLVGRALAATARVERPGVHWKVEGGPWFDNQVGSLRYDGASARVAIEKTVPGDPHPDLETTIEREL